MEGRYRNLMLGTDWAAWLRRWTFFALYGKVVRYEFLLLLHRNEDASMWRVRANAYGVCAHAPRFVDEIIDVKA